MGSESFSGGVRAGASAEEAEVQKLDGVSSAGGIKRPFDKWTSMASRKDESCAVNSSAIASWNNVTENELNRNVGQQSSLRGKEAFEGHNFGSTDANLARTAGVEARLMLKPRKMGRNTSGSSKGLRMLQVDGSISKTGEDDARSVSIELSSNLASCNNGERTQMSKQRINSSGKRGDKRNGKVPKGNFSLKNGLISFSSAAGGHNFLGLYGLKSDALDVAETVEDIPLNELLDGSYKSPLFTKDKEKKTLNSNESLLHVIRNACSLLQRPVQARSCSDDDDKITEPKHTGSSSAIETDGSKGDASASNVSSDDKETGGELKTAETSDDPPLYKPMDILKRIALPPSKDLDALLLDATKPASSRNTPDPRLGKPASQRTGLVPFPWSHGFSGNHKSGPDAAKLSTSRTTCQAKWARMKNTSTPQEGCPSFAVDLQSLTYDHSLVPSGSQPSGHPESGNQILHSSGGQNMGPTESGNQSLAGGQTSCPSDKGNAPLIPDSSTSCKRVFSSLAACSTSQVSSDEPSPRCLTAARTLCEIASQSVKHNTNGTVKCIKKPTQKSSRAPKLKLNEKSEKPFAAPKVMGSDNMIRVSDGTFPSKKPKLSSGTERNGIVPRNFDRKGPPHWSAPRSVRSSPSKFFKDATAEPKGHNSSFVDKLYMMPPPARVKDKGSSSQQKPRKVLSGEWNHSSSKME